MGADTCRHAERRQRGAVAVVVALSLTVMLGFVGLAIDGGRLYLTKTELQNAADACALAASYELTGAPAIAAEAFARADAAGRLIGKQNKVDFQGTGIADADITLAYSPTLDGGWSAAGSAPPSSKYVRCTIRKTDIQPYFMQLVGAGAQVVSALATATLAPAQTNCAVPMAFCAQGAAPDFGYVPGDWYGMDFRETGNNANYTGNFRWIDFDPGNVTPGCPGGGAQELSCVMQGAGQCNLPPPMPGGCSTSGSASPTPGCVGQNGAINSIEAAYNSRFGVYQGGGGAPNAGNAPPDFSGYCYSTENWGLGRDAYGGSVGGTPRNFKDAREAHEPAANEPGVDPAFFSNPYTASTVATHTTSGADRRLVVVPIVDCSGFTGGQHAPIRAYACVLLLDPYRKQGNDVKTRMEYLGRSNEAGSPCASSGIAGNTSSQGPMVPALVQ